MNTFYAKNRREWRKWLSQNSKDVREIWLIYYKKHSGKPRIPYEDAVEEALCFGWIDSTVRRVDEDCYAQKFTPRQAKSQWTQGNIERVERLKAAGRMTAAGLKAFEPANRKTIPAMPTELAPDLEKLFRKHPEAWKNFQNFPPYYRRMTIGMVGSAKKEETRISRLTKLIEFSARNERIKFM